MENENKNTETNMTEGAKETGATEKATEDQLREELEALKGKYAGLEADNKKLKDTNNKLSSENADWKKQSREKLSAEEKANAEREEQDAQTKQHIAELEREVKVSKSKQRYIEYGFDSKEAEDLSTKEIEGDMESILKAFKTKQDNEIKKAKEEWLNNPPSVKTGGKTTGKDEEMDDIEKAFNKGLGLR